MDGRTVARGTSGSIRPRRISAALLLPLLLLLSCRPSGEERVRVTGKTAFRGMAIEEVRVRALRRDGDAWREVAATRSGYHGSFVIDLPPGQYRLEATGEIHFSGKPAPLSGVVEDLRVPPGNGRIDRVVVELSPSAAGPTPGPLTPPGAGPS